MQQSKLRSLVTRLAREPVVHFLVLGALVFAVDGRLRREPAPGGSIVVDQAVRARLAAEVQRRTGQKPTEAEMTRAVDDWLDEEVLFRRAVSLDLHETDLVVRRELVQRMRFLMEDVRPIEAPTDEELRGYLASHAERFAEGRLYSFEQLFFSRGSRGSGLEKDCRTALDALTAAPDATVAADAFFGGAHVTDASEDTVARTFGRAFADALPELPVGTWAGPVRSSFGLHVVRVASRRAAPPTDLEAVRRKVSREIRDGRRESENRRAIDALRAEYGLAPSHGGPAG